MTAVHLLEAGARDGARLGSGRCRVKASPFLAGQLGPGQQMACRSASRSVRIVRRVAWPATTLAAAQPARRGFRHRIMAAAAMLAVAGPGGIGGPSPA